jgi:arylsulfatase A-like enzyme
MMMRTLPALGLMALLACAAPGSPAPARPPNIVILLADDQGWGDLSVHGNSNLSTPAIDSLARDGALFERFYVCPVCSPTRAELLTGRYHLRGGVRDVTSGGERLNLDERTIAEIFRASGYATGAFGKWHNGSQYPYHPNGRGFDEYYGFTSGHWGNYFDALLLDHNGRTVKGSGYLADDLTDHALEFIQQHRAGPFFCYLPFNTPHSPMQVPERFFSKFAGLDPKLRHQGPEKEDLAMTRAALAMCENIDWNVGRVLERLEKLNLAGDTIVLYFSDNGPNSWRWNGGMKGRKGSTDEGGVRSPLLVRWPGHIPAGTRIHSIAGAIDLLPTLADLAALRIPPGKPLDGVSLKPLLLREAAEGPPDRLILSHWAGKYSVRSQRYRLDAAGRLFDLDLDPGQDRDVSKDHPEEVSRLSQALAGWRKEMAPVSPKDERPFLVGHPGARTTPLPARDGVPHGSVKRSASAPNCSYFTNWTRPEDRITWNIEVLTAGRYDVVLHYTCPAADVGSTVELSFKDNRLEGTVSNPHDPPLLGRDHDRAPRTSESFVKEFKPWRLGAIDLPAGRGELALRALKISGSQVMDVRLLELLRQD